MGFLDTLANMAQAGASGFGNDVLTAKQRRERDAMAEALLRAQEAANDAFPERNQLENKRIQATTDALLGEQQQRDKALQLQRQELGLKIAEAVPKFFSGNQLADDEWGQVFDQAQAAQGIVPVTVKSKQTVVPGMFDRPQSPAREDLIGSAFTQFINPVSTTTQRTVFPRPPVEPAKVQAFSDNKGNVGVFDVSRPGTYKFGSALAPENGMSKLDQQKLFYYQKQREGMTDDDPQAAALDGKINALFAKYEGGNPPGLAPAGTTAAAPSAPSNPSGIRRVDFGKTTLFQSPKVGQPAAGAANTTPAPSSPPSPPAARPLSPWEKAAQTADQRAQAVVASWLTESAKEKKIRDADTTDFSMSVAATKAEMLLPRKRQELARLEQQKAAIDAGQSRMSGAQIIKFGEAYDRLVNEIQELESKAAYHSPKYFPKS